MNDTRKHPVDSLLDDIAAAEKLDASPFVDDYAVVATVAGTTQWMIWSSGYVVPATTDAILAATL